MSSYIQFFIRHEDNFLPIGIYSRNTKIYQEFKDFIPYGEVRAIKIGMLDMIRKDIEHEVKYYQERIDHAKEMKEYVATMNNSMEEKMEWVSNIENAIYECSAEKEEAESVKHYVNFLDDIVDAVEDDTNFDHKKYLYAGIEVGEPTVDDIQEN